MQLFKSFFCLQGFDNRNRFSSISFTVYILFILTSLTFSIYTSIVFLFIFASINLLTTLRRSNDAKFNKKWLLGSTLSFIASGLLIILTVNPYCYLLLLIPIAFSTYLLGFSSKTAFKYILGYFGPVDLSEYDHSTIKHQQQSQRIEPILLYNSENNDLLNNQFYKNHTAEDQETIFTPQLESSDVKDNIIFQTAHYIGESIRTKILAHNKILISLFIMSLLCIFIIFFIKQTSPPIINNPIVEPILQSSLSINKLSKVTFPDNFSLMLSQYKGLIVNWQTDTASVPGDVWSLATAQGEQDCQQIIFNNGDKIRTTSVNHENDFEYFAYFSPLDTKKLLQSIAFKGRFSMCGYTFSLKGSQEILGKHKEYAEFIEY